MKFSTDYGNIKGIREECPCPKCTHRSNKIWEGNCRQCMTTKAHSKNQWPGFEEAIDSGIEKPKHYKATIHTPIKTFSFGDMPKNEIGEEKSE